MSRSIWENHFAIQQNDCSSQPGHSKYSLSVGQTYLFSKYLLSFQYTEQALLWVLEIRQGAKETKDPLNSWTLCSDNLITM